MEKQLQMYEIGRINNGGVGERREIGWRNGRRKGGGRGGREVDLRFY